jgi:hypothetical protein
VDVATINQTIRALVEDPNGDYANDGFLQPLLTLEYTNIANELRLYAPDIDEYVVELPAVAAGTPDLSAFMAQNKPLYWLLSPREIEWKLAGTPATNYVDAEGPLDKLRDIAAPGIAALDCWSYTHLNIGLSSFSTPLDLRIRGEFLFPPLSSSSGVVQIGQNTLPVFSYRIAKLIAIKRGNQQWVANYGLEANNSFDVVKQGLIHMRQSKSERVGRVNDCGGQGPRFTISQ